MYGHVYLRIHYDSIQLVCCCFVMPRAPSKALRLPIVRHNCTAAHLVHSRASFVPTFTCTSRWVRWQMYCCSCHSSRQYCWVAMHSATPPLTCWLVGDYVTCCGVISLGELCRVARS